MQSGFSSTVDQLYHLTQSTSKFFVGGFGKPENLSRLFQMRKFIMDKRNCNQLLRQCYPQITIKKNENDGSTQILEGHFLSPFAKRFPDLVPEPIATARFQIVLPSKWNDDNKSQRPMCIHLAGTGDHYFWRRRLLMAKPLAKNEIGSILLENPYYGLRKPTYQRRSSLYNVTDLFIMGGCLILESLVLLDWCEKQGYGPLALTGISMGGHMCSLAACNYEKPVALVPCLSWSTASCVFTQGVMTSDVAWNTLKNQYFSDEFRQQESHILSALRQDIKVVALDLVKKCSENANKDKAVIENVAFFTKLKFLIDLIQRYLVDKQAVDSSIDAEVMEFLRQVLDEFTHLSRFSKPVDPSLITVVCAESDAYVPRDKVCSLTDIWPEAQIRYIKNKGHVSAFLFEQAAFRAAIVEALNKMSLKYDTTLKQSYSSSQKT